ncbi:MAG: Threonylcarbamoyl-AMP synthase [Opitutia bacterium UBA7350]|nr:MAG: Threonylcarbamoyl-AMP synthase [Opitutae bacterium UBA7350]
MILSSNSKNLKLCAELIRKDDIVAVPTETVYGLAGNALSETAVRKIFEIKGRPLIDPLIVHCFDYTAALELIVNNSLIDHLAKQFWPGPLTIIAQKKALIPDIVTAGLKSVAIRVPSQTELQKLLKISKVPLAAPSANPFGYVSPTEASHVKRTLGEKITAILDGGRTLHGVESTIIDARNENKPLLLRYGPIDPIMLEQHLNYPLLVQTTTRNENRAQNAPGLLSKHYSPRARVHLVNQTALVEAVKTIAGSQAIVSIKKSQKLIHHPGYHWLSEDGCLETAANNLFALLQNLDEQKYKEITIELAENSGIGLAINDRLKRAAAK